MKHRKLKKEVKIFIVGAILFALATINICNNFNNITKDDLGNTCRGGVVKVCEK